MSNEAPKVINAPDEIWLNYGDAIGEDITDHNERSDVGWTEVCAATDFNVRYVRADIAQSRIDALEAESGRVTKLLHQSCCEIERLKSELAAATAKGSVCDDLAEWSVRYPRGGQYSHHLQPKMDGELIELENRAKAIRAAAKSLERT